MWYFLAKPSQLDSQSCKSTLYPSLYIHLTNLHFNKHGSCPTCRHIFLNIRTPSESDDESSDGGEYIPNADDFEDEDEDAFLDVDGFSEADVDEFPVEPMDLDFAIWGDEDSNILDLGDDDPGDLGDAEMDDIDQDDPSEWGLTDGESESMSSSEGDPTTGRDEESVHGTWPRRRPFLRMIQLMVIASLLFSAGNT
jgi:hypothetical protein